MPKFKVVGNRLDGARQIAWLKHRDVYIEPKYLVIHYTGGGAVSSSIKYLREIGYSYQLIIDRDGAVIQGTPLLKRASHAGASNWKGLDSLNNYSIGISLANIGYLDRRGTKFFRTNGHGDPTTNIYNESEVTKARHWNGHNGSTTKGWELFTEAQYESLRAVCAALVSAYPSIIDAIGHDEIAIGRKPDPGMALGWERIYPLFTHRQSDLGPLYEVNVSPLDRLNVRNGPNGSWGISDKFMRGEKVHLRSYSYVYRNGKPQKSNWASIALEGSTKHHGFVSSRFLNRILN